LANLLGKKEYKMSPSCSLNVAHTNCSNSSNFSYLYHQNNYLYPDDETSIEESSQRDYIMLNGHKVIFTLNPQSQPAIYYQQSFISTTQEALKRIPFNLSSFLNQELLDKVAIITNYLCQGTAYEYVDKSAEIKKEKMCFFVKHGLCCCKVKFPFLKRDGKVIYKKTEKIK
jgi:hypothetical protein